MTDKMVPNLAGSPPSRGICAAILFLAMLLFAADGSSALADEMDFVCVAKDRPAFVLEATGRPLVPWGFNYDHDEAGRLIEDYWDDQWNKVEADFQEMKALGADVVRVHLQVGRFMQSPQRPNEHALDQLVRLVRLAERLHLYLDLTGLGCYHKQAVPAWYDALSEQERWDAQACFWQAIARRCAGSPAIFCYDLMNEPVSPAGPKKDDWLGPAFAGKHFVQYIALDQAGRDRVEIARAWIHHLAAAIRQHDRRHMITVGLVDWSLDRPGLTSGFVPEKIAAELDFVCVHLYPEAGKVDAALDTLRGFAVGKPVLIEETFPLRAPLPEFGDFIERSGSVANGWLGFYWGKTPAEYRATNHSIADAMMLGWLEFFEKRARQLRE